MAFIPTQYNNPLFVYSLRRLIQNYTDPLVRVIRESDFVEVDVYADSNDEISYDSIIARTSQTAATTLGEFLNIDGYTDVDSLGSVYEGRLSRVYDQSAGEFDIDVPAYGDAFLFVETNLAEYNGSTAIHKVNGIPTFRPQVFDIEAFRISNIIGRNISMHFLTEGVYDAGYFFGFIQPNVFAVFLRYLNDTGASYANFVPYSGVASDVDVNAVYFNSDPAENTVGLLYEDTLPSGNPTIITSLEFSIADTASNQSVFTDNTGVFELYPLTWYCDFIAFDGYDPVRRLIIEGLYADQSDNAPRTPNLLLNAEDPTQSGFLAQYPNAAAAYSVRSLTGYLGAPSEANPSPKILRVRRSIDNVEVDVYTDSTGFVSLNSR